MTQHHSTENEVAARRLHEVYISKVNSADEHGNDQQAMELADDYLAQLRTFSLC